MDDIFYQDNAILITQNYIDVSGSKYFLRNISNVNIASQDLNKTVVINEGNGLHSTANFFGYTGGIFFILSFFTGVSPHSHQAKEKLY